MPASPSGAAKRFQLPLFFVLTFGLSWFVWVPQAAGALGLVGVQSRRNPR
jgi:hypothetical protein